VDKALVRLGASLIHGTGVFAFRPILAGERILPIDDSRIVDATHPLDPSRGESEMHCDYVSGGRTVLLPAPERHINHSCDPNTYWVTHEGKRWVVSLREIGEGEELTVDYLVNCHGGDDWDCACGAPVCRKTQPPSFFDLPWEVR
jgi:SET domain-containing protein